MKVRANDLSTRSLKHASVAASVKCAAAAVCHAVAERAGADERHGLRLVLERLVQVVALVWPSLPLGHMRREQSMSV